METTKQAIHQTTTPQIIKRQKWYINNFIEKLFKINMSQDVLVDIVINDDPINPRDNQTTIVGRPKMLGSSTKQMRHVTPYSFIEATIKEKIATTEKPEEYKSYIDNIMEAIKPLITSKKGICLTVDQYSKLSSNISLQNESSETFKLSTTSNEYYLIYNDTLIEQFEYCKDFSQDEKNKAKTDFSAKFEKYITYGIKYLTEEILDPKDVNTITIVCEGIARIILTLFNQDRYAAFPEEGNSIPEEIRVYKNKDDAKKPQNKEYSVYSHQKITQDMNLKNNSGIHKAQAKYDAHIRIVDNEGAIVKKTAKVLKIINSLVSSKIFGQEKAEDKEYQKEYNEKYNFYVDDTQLKCKDKYNQKIDIKKDLMDIVPYHVAKHLYSVFDFKPLENSVLAPKQKGDTIIFQVYPSATGTKIAEYSKQNGKEYRELQYNCRKGYNDDAIFRSKMSNEETKEVLKNKVVSHVIVSLLPFDELIVGCEFNETRCCKGDTILQALCELVKTKYNSEGITKLDNAWMTNVQNECSGYFKDVLGESLVTEDTYY